MPYSKTTWVEGTTGITAARLNNIEAGVEVGYNNTILYAVATGSANAYIVTLNPAPTALTEGMSIAIKINVDSTGVSTINVNGLGAKGIKKANGNDVTNLKAGGIYTLRYNGVNFQLLGEGGEYGTAGAGDVKVGVTFGTENGVVTGTFTSDATAVASDIIASKTSYVNGNKVTGTIPDRGAGGTKTPTGSNITLPSGRYTTDIIIAGVSVPVANVLSGTTIAGQAGTMPNKAGVGQATTYTNNDANPYIEVNIPTAGYYNTASWVQIANGDMIPSNIKNGVNIFGVTGIMPSKYFGTGADGALSTSGNMTLANTLDGDIVVKNYTNLTINAGHTLTVSNRCKGLLIYVSGNLIVNGSISMTAKAPSTTDASQKLLDHMGRLKAISDTLYGMVVTARGGTGGNGGTAIGIYNGGGGGTGGIGKAAHSFGGGYGGGGGGGAGGDTDFNNFGSGYSGGAGAPIGSVGVVGTTGTGGYSAGGAGGYSGGKGGDGNGGGSGGGGGTGGVGYGTFTQGGAGQPAGGLLMIVVQGTVSGTGSFQANGSAGGAKGGGSIYGCNTNGGGGGGAGGGTIIILHNGYTFSGSLQVAGGIGGASAGSSYAGTAGSVGTTIVTNLAI